MRGVRFTKGEHTLLQIVLQDHIKSGAYNNKSNMKHAQTSLAKLEALNKPKQPNGLAVGPLESALVGAARGKVVPTTPGGYARASRQALSVGATVESMAEVGQWLSRQKWLTEPMTIIGVLNKWPEWYPRAKASAPPRGTSEGLGGGNQTGDVRPSAGGGGGPITKGRAPAGLR